MTHDLLIEACVDSVETARAAQEAGASRLELCGAGEGGVTPSPALLRDVMAIATVPVHVMVRPREGDFTYAPDELRAMRASVRAAAEAGAHGVVFGVLREDGRLDLERMAELVVASYPMATVCHRAFDRTPDADGALDDVLALGMAAVLTSGHAPTALEGADTLRRHVTQAAGRLRILAGGGIRAVNARAVVQRSGVRQVHARATEPATFAALVRELAAAP